MTNKNPTKTQRRPQNTSKRAQNKNRIKAQNERKTPKAIDPPQKSP